MLCSSPTWGEICVRCSCRVCFAKCVCKDSILFVSLFKPAVRVPYAWIAATPSLHKRCKSIKGSAGRKRLRLIAGRQCDEKVINSKVTYLQGSRQTLASAPEVCIPSPVLPTSWSCESEDDDFVDVRVRMTSWAATVLSVLTKFHRSRSSPSRHGSPASPRDLPSLPPVSLPLHRVFVLRLNPLVDSRANHRLRLRLRNGAQHRNRGYAHAAFFFLEKSPPSPEMTPFPTLSGRKLACPRG
jgi:hypothetical protein